MIIRDGAEWEMQNPEVEKGIVLTKFNELTKLWVVVVRINGIVRCRQANTANRAAKLAYKAAAL